ncbi:MULTISPECIES: hypothetical protein [unclassified Leptolyngbya]|uniref:hypothetical protein n=1 Tax=unclassified Leptolyngbya TaxID=2650499 RepID=UPI0016895C6D|nr:MULTISPECIES: hypothetical protein [unclassified Leptolyngbya]MBD1914175.1 hypothetical protein [Leptolyngbya sp. FACHB-8]MBD2157182.1 hypothetical protein [Leptolyngbya sp. FACHB-16]
MKDKTENAVLLMKRTAQHFQFYLSLQRFALESATIVFVRATLRAALTKTTRF